VHLVGGDEESGIRHLCRIEDALLEEDVERLAGDFLDDVTLKVGGDAVNPALARLLGKRKARECGDELIRSSAPIP
jgi:hypothetical protein